MTDNILDYRQIDTVENKYAKGIIPRVKVQLSCDEYILFLFHFDGILYDWRNTTNQNAVS